MSFKITSVFFFGLMVATTFVYSQNFQTVIVGNLSLSISDLELPWAEAVSACEQRNQTLLSVKSAEKDKILVDQFVNNGSSVLLPGANSWIAAIEAREGVWTWAPLGEPLYYTRWFVGQPDDTDNINCVYQAVGNLLYWRDANCSASMFFVCESQVQNEESPNAASNLGVIHHVLFFASILSVYIKWNL